MTFFMMAVAGCWSFRRDISPVTFPPPSTAPRAPPHPMHRARRRPPLVLRPGRSTARLPHILLRHLAAPPRRRTRHRKRHVLESEHVPGCAPPEQEFPPVSLTPLPPVYLARHRRTFLQLLAPGSILRSCRQCAPHESTRKNRTHCLTTSNPFSPQVDLTLPSSLPELPLIGRMSNTQKNELLLARQLMQTSGLISRVDQSISDQIAEEIAGLEWHLQCAAAANSPAGWALCPTSHVQFLMDLTDITRSAHTASSLERAAAWQF